MHSAVACASSYRKRIGHIAYPIALYRSPGARIYMYHLSRFAWHVIEHSQGCERCVGMHLAHCNCRSDGFDSDVASLDGLLLNLRECGLQLHRSLCDVGWCAEGCIGSWSWLADSMRLLDLDLDALVVGLHQMGLTYVNRETRRIPTVDESVPDCVVGHRARKQTFNRIRRFNMVQQRRAQLQEAEMDFEYRMCCEQYVNACLWWSCSLKDLLLRHQVRYDPNLHVVACSLCWWSRSLGVVYGFPACGPFCLDILPVTYEL